MDSGQYTVSVKPPLAQGCKKLAESDSVGSDTAQVGAPLKRPRKRKALNGDIR
jgi:hypothetical protein